MEIVSEERLRRLIPPHEKVYPLSSIKGFENECNEKNDNDCYQCVYRFPSVYMNVKNIEEANRMKEKLDQFCRDVILSPQWPQWKQ